MFLFFVIFQCLFRLLTLYIYLIGKKKKEKEENYYNQTNNLDMCFLRQSCESPPLVYASSDLA